MRLLAAARRQAPQECSRRPPGFVRLNPPSPVCRFISSSVRPSYAAVSSLPCQNSRSLSSGMPSLLRVVAVDGQEVKGQALAMTGRGADLMQGARTLLAAVFCSSNQTHLEAAFLMSSTVCSYLILH